MTKSAYIHIPFCKSKCKYCSFISFNLLKYIEQYFLCLEKDIKYNYNGELLKTLYIGGGTPSVVPINYISRILKLFKFEGSYELTFEMNPDDVSEDYLRKLYDLGVNRLSFGSQTFNDKILNFIGRRHNSKEIVDAVELARKVGFTNISLDLIYGLPYQTKEILDKDLQDFLSLDIQHISTYGLKIEESSIWGQIYNFEKNSILDETGKELLLPDSDEQADMYEYINEILESNGFLRYEISNFSRKGFESKHNLNYWNNSEYYGFGIAAHGYLNGFRYSKPITFKEYFVDSVGYKDKKVLSLKEKLEEEIFLGFRKRSGINVALIKEKFGVDFEIEYRSALDKYSDFIEKTPQGYTLNLQGVLLSNIILSEFI